MCIRDRELLPTEVLHCGNSEFRVFLQKIVENIEIFRSYRTSDANDAKTHFLVHYQQFQLVCCRSYTHSRCCFMPNRFMWSLHFRSRDKDGVHTIRSAVSENPLLYANLTSLSFIHRVPKKTKQICFCQNFVKFPQISIIFGRKMGNDPSICQVYSLTTSPNLRHHLTVLNANVPNCYRTPNVVICNKLLTT